MKDNMEEQIRQYFIDIYNKHYNTYCIRFFGFREKELQLPNICINYNGTNYLYQLYEYDFIKWKNKKRRIKLKKILRNDNMVSRLF